MKRDRKRTDEMGRAFAGSQLQVQIYVARRQMELSAVVASAMQRPDLAQQIRWTAPLENQRFVEPYDGRFLDAVALGERRCELRAFWPSGGPHWDALAVVGDDAPPTTVLLGEGKSYPGEVCGRGCTAKAESSLRLIDSAIRRAQEWLRAPDGPNWKGSLYQYANRLAHVYFLNQLLGIPTWLVNLCFVHDRTTRATSEAEWRVALPAFKKQLGFTQERIPWFLDVLLPARDRGELMENGCGGG